MAVEGVDLVQVGVVEALIREILNTALLQLNLLDIADPHHLLGVKDEMVVRESVIVEQVHKNQVVGNEAAANERVGEAVDCHRPIVYFQLLVHVKLRGLDLLWRSPLRQLFVRIARLLEDTHLEFAIVVVGEGELVTGRILLNLLHFDVVRFAAAVLLLKGESWPVVNATLEIIDSHPVLPFALFGDGERTLRVIGEGDGLDRELRRHLLEFQQVFELLSVVPEHWMRLHQLVRVVLIVLLLLVCYLLFVV